MGRIRPWLAFITALALVLTLAPGVGAAPQAAGERKASAKPVLSPTAKAKPKNDGIEISIKDLGPDVTGVDVYRSTAAGVRGAKVNDEPVRGRTFMDEGAKAGVQYYYTVVVSGRKAAGKDRDGDDEAPKDRTPRFASVDVLPQAKAGVMRAEKAQGDHRAAGAARRARGKKAASAPSGPRAAQAGVSAALVNAKTNVASGTVINVNTTWTLANSPYYLQGDVVVAAGRTLTIEPGVEVYFADFDDGGTYGTEYGFATNPTSRCDLIVHGRLIANGTATRRIVFSSAQASLNNSMTLPPPPAGDWGCLFFDGMSASSMSRCRVYYGEGIWAQGTSRPYVSYCDIANTGTSGSDMPWAAAFFEDVKTDSTTPRARVVGNTIASEDEGIFFWNERHSGSQVLDPHVTDNTIRAQYGIDLEIDHVETATAGTYIVRGYLARNRFYGGESDNDGVYLYVDATSTGQATINTQLMSNTVRSPDGDGVYAYAESDRGHVKAVPTIRGGSYHAQDYGVYIEAYSMDTSMTNMGVAWASPVVSDVTITGTDDDAIYLYADSAGMGSAKADSSFTRVNFESAGCEGLYDYAESEWGPASASPTLTDCVGETHDACEAVWCEANSWGAGYAAASPTIRRGSFKATDDDCVYNYAESDEGRAAAVVHAYGTNLWGYDSAIYSEAYGDDESSTASGGANASTTLVDSIAHGYDDDGVYNYARSSGKGAAFASPLILRSTLTCDYYNGLYCDAESAKSSAHANPRVIDSYVLGEEEAIETDVDQEDGDGVGDAHSHPMVVRSTVVSQYYEAMYLRADTNGTGDAHTSPIVTDSHVVAHYDDDCFDAWASVNGTGTASVVPEVTRSHLRGEDDAVALDADGPGTPSVPTAESKSHIGGFFQDCTLWAEEDYGVDAASDNDDGNGADFTTRFARCDITAQDDYGMYIWVGGTGPAGTMVTCAPRIISCDARMTADGLYFYANGNDSDTTETVTCAPDIMYTPIYATWDYGVYAEAYSQGHGAVRNDTYMLRSSVRSEDECVYLWTESDGDADATNTSKIAGRTRYLTPAESWEEDGIHSDVSSENGNATEKLQVKNMFVRSNSDGVWSNVHVDSAADKLATQQAKVDRVTCDGKWDQENEGIQTYVGGTGSALLKSTIVDNRVVSAEDGILAYVWGSTANTMTPVITGNTVSHSTDDGINLYVESGPVPGADSLVTITDNAVSRSGECGIKLVDVSRASVMRNKVSRSGTPRSTDEEDSSGLYWSGATGGAVKYNLIRGQRHGVSLESCNPYPTVNYNNFMDLNGLRNQPWNMWTDCPTPSAVNAENNWWGYTSTGDIAKTINEVTTDTAVDFTPFSGAYIP